MNITLSNINDSNQEQAVQQVQCCMISLFDFVGSNKLKRSEHNLCNKKQDRRMMVAESTYTYEMPDMSELTIKVHSDDMMLFACTVVETEDG
jgi:hypothetical protein